MYTEKLRRRGDKARKMILRNPAWFADAAEWYKALPLCWAIIRERYEKDTIDENKKISSLKPALSNQPLSKPWLFADINNDPIDVAFPLDKNFPHWPLYGIFDNEMEAIKNEGPILRRLKNAWKAATFKFLFSGRKPSTRYIDLDVVDAQRIVMLAAFTFVKSFYGAVFDLNLPWDHPSDCEAMLEGRGEYCVLKTTEIHGETLLEIIDASIELLQPENSSIADDASKPVDEIPSDGELAIWKALDGKVIPGKELAKNNYLDVSHSHETIRKQISNLNNMGYVIKNKQSRGFWRPDAPPPD